MGWLVGLCTLAVRTETAVGNENCTLSSSYVNQNWNAPLSVFTAIHLAVLNLCAWYFNSGFAWIWTRLKTLFFGDGEFVCLVWFSERGLLSWTASSGCFVCVCARARVRACERARERNRPSVFTWGRNWNSEYFWYELRLARFKQCVIFVCYRCPNSRLTAPRTGTWRR